MNMFEMKEEYYTGIKLVDDEHKELFRIARDAYDVFQDNYIADKFDNIVSIIENLKQYAITHFAHEEAYMESIGYKKRFSHKIEHVEFLEKLNEIDFEQMDHNQTGTLLDILEFLSNWLVNHILENDKRIGKAE
jgi:hemerythrin